MLSNFLVTRSQTNQFQNWLKLQESSIAHSATFTFYQEICVINFFTKINIAFYVTFTSYNEIKVVLSLSTKDHHRVLCASAQGHWKCFCKTSCRWAPWEAGQRRNLQVHGVEDLQEVPLQAGGRSSENIWQPGDHCPQFKSGMAPAHHWKGDNNKGPPWAIAFTTGIL